MRTEDKDSGSTTRQVSIEQAKFEFEQWQIKEEIRLKSEELEIKRKESSKSVWSSPLLIAVIGLFTTIVVSIIQNSCQSAATRELERQRFESTLIQKALESDSQKLAAERFKSYLELGLIKDEAIRTQIEKYVNEPKTIPLQPSGNVSENDYFVGVTRRSAKLSIGSGTVQNFGDLNDLINSLPADNAMTSHDPPITTEANSARVDEEQRNVRVRAFLYAASKEESNDYQLVIGRAPGSQPERYMLMRVSGLPPSTSESFPQLSNARAAFKNFFKENLPGFTYDFFNPPVPVEIEGSLLFNITRAAGAKPGPSSLRDQIPTFWQVHPITRITFEP